MTRPPIPARLLHLTAMLTALVLWGFTCVNQDYAAIETLPFEGKFGSRFTSQVFSPYASRLTVDYVVQADPAAPLDLELTATTLQPEGSIDIGASSADTGTPSGSTDAGDAGDADAGDTTPDAPLGTSTVRIQLAAGERQVGRFDERVLLSGVGVELDAYCISTPCIGNVQYSVLLGQHECRADNACSSEEICDERLGRCTPRACTSNDDCLTDQTCNTDFERCISSGVLCSVARPGGDAPGAAPALLLLLAALTAAVVRRRRAQQASQRPQVTSQRAARRAWPLALLLLPVAALAAPSAASAQSTFDKPTVTLGFGTRALVFTGELADVSGTGLGLEYAQGLQYRYFGVQAAISTSYFLTFQEPPPVARGLQLYALRFSPAFLYPWRSFRFIGSLDYQRVGVVSNALVRYTGPSLEFNTVGASLGARWHTNPLLLGVRVGYAQFFEFDAALWTFTLEVAVEALL